MRHVRPKYQVFLSSTYRDLHEERQAATWAILTAGHIPAGMENFTAKDDRGWKTITRTIDQSDYYVLLLAGLYGSVDPSTGLSWTEREYDYARERSLPVLAFVRERSATPGDRVESDPVKMGKLAAFLEKVRGSHLCKDWSDKDDLPGKVTEALRHQIEEDEDEDHARPGWYRGDRVPSASALDEFARLSAETERLREENTRLKAELGAKDAGVYPELKRLVDEGRKKVWIDSSIMVDAEGPLRSPRTAEGHAQVLSLTAQALTLESNEIPRSSNRYEGAVEIRNILPRTRVNIPLAAIVSARAAAHADDMLHLKLNGALLFKDGFWTLP